MGIAYHPDEFFVDESYYCKLCGFAADTDDEFVSHILAKHYDEALKSKAVVLTPKGAHEYLDIDSIKLAEEFSK